VDVQVGFGQLREVAHSCYCAAPQR
jgi:hypothetical protein